MGDVHVPKRSGGRARPVELARDPGRFGVENANAGALFVVTPSGPDWTAGAGGGVTSRVNARLAAEPSWLPTKSVARTSNVWAPSASATVVSGEVQS